MDKQETYTPEEMEEYGIDEEGNEIDGYDHWSHCEFCDELYPDSELRQEQNLGRLCRRCADALWSRGEKLTFIDKTYHESFINTVRSIAESYLEACKVETSNLLENVDLAETEAADILKHKVSKLVSSLNIEDSLIKEKLYEDLVTEIVTDPERCIKTYSLTETVNITEETDNIDIEDDKELVEAIEAGSLDDVFNWLDFITFDYEDYQERGDWSLSCWPHEAHFGSAWDHGQSVMEIQLDNDKEDIHIHYGDLESTEEFESAIQAIKDRLSKKTVKEDLEDTKRLAKEEQDAIASYQKSIDNPNSTEKEKKLYKHIQSEEREHEEELDDLAAGKKNAIKEEIKENELFFVTDKNGLEIGYELEKNKDGSIHLYGQYNASNNAEGDGTEFEEDFEDEEELNNWLKSIETGYFFESLKESLGQDYSEIPLIDKFNFENKKQNNLPGIEDIKGFIEALNATGYDTFKCRTSTFGKNISLGDLKDAALDITRAGWRISRTWDTSLDGFDEIYLCEKEKVNEGLNEEKNLLEAPEKHDTLNPKLFDEGNKLIPEVREKLLAIAKDFTDGLEEDEIKFDLKDIKIVGSNASYNYNDQSDIDLHLELDTKGMKCPDNLYPVLYDKVRSLWNKNNSPVVKGIPVEIFVETSDTEQLSEPDEVILEEDIKSKYKDIFDADYQRSYGIPTFQDETDIKILKGIYNKAVEFNDELIKDAVLDRLEDLGDTSLTEARKQTALKSNGIYSVLNDTWIKEPVAEDIPELDQEGFDKLLAEWKAKLEEIKAEPTIEKIEKFIEDLYDLRKTAIADEGEYSIGNLVFKQLRNDGDIDALKELKQSLKDKELSLESLEEEVKPIFKIDVDGEWFTDADGNELEFATEEEAENFIDEHELENATAIISNIDKVKVSRLGGLAGLDTETDKEKETNFSERLGEGTFVIVSTENPLNDEKVDFNAEEVLKGLEFIHENEVEPIDGYWQGEKEPKSYLVKIKDDSKAEELAKLFNQAAYIIIKVKEDIVETRMFERTSLEDEFKEAGHTSTIITGDEAKEKMGYTVFEKDGLAFSFAF